MSIPADPDRVADVLRRTATPDDLRSVWPATPTALAAIRRDLQIWLLAHAWPVQASADIVGAVNEAASNVVEHAYLPGHLTGSITLYAWEYCDPYTPNRRRAAITVTDAGRWKDAIPDLDRSRHGLDIMTALMFECQIERSYKGTSVVLISHDEPAD